MGTFSLKVLWKHLKVAMGAPLRGIKNLKVAMRGHLRGVKLAIFVASVLHGIATGNMLSAEVRTVCVDVHVEAVTKLRDRGSAQATGLVMDCASFLRELARALRARG